MEIISLATLFLSVCTKFRCIAEGQDTAYWTVQKKIENYGENVTIVCKLNKSLQQPRHTKKWYKGEDMISYNNLTTNHTKYAAEYIPDGIQLTILDFSPDDVNRVYNCEIGFYKSLEKNLSENLVFKDKHFPSKSGRSEKERIAFHMIYILYVLIVPVILVIAWKGRLYTKSKQQQNSEQAGPGKKILLLPEKKNGSKSNQDQLQPSMKNDYKDQVRSV